MAMIKKIISIKNVGRFRQYSSAGDLEFRKKTLFYSENGKGKTTLSAIFKSLKTGNGDYIRGRSTLGVQEEPEVDLLFDFGKVCFKKTAWDNVVPDIEIFDSMFINENIFSGMYLDHEHKKNLYQFIIGAEGVSLAEKVNSIDILIRNKNQELAIKKSEIEKTIFGDVRIENFVSLLPFNGDIEKRILEKETEATSLKKTKEITDKSTLKQIYLPAIDKANLRQVLTKTIEQISKHAEEKTKAHIALFLDANGEEWISDGLKYIKRDSCPFCTHSLINNEIIPAFKDYFGEAYSSLKKEVSVFQKDTSELLSSNRLIGIQREISTNDLLVDFWKDYINLNYCPILFEKIQRIYEELSAQISDLLRVKEFKPLESVSLNEDFERMIIEYNDFLSEIKNYNESIIVMNELIEEKKQKTKSLNISSVEKELEVLKNQKIRYQRNIIILCDKYCQLNAEKKKAEDEKKEAKNELDKYSNQIFGKYEGKINFYLDRFGAGFKIAQTCGNYKGGKPSANYCLVINDQSVDLGDKDSHIGSPCLKNTLSEGDKNTLAFSFFLAKLDLDDRLADKIVILDDPISSLDKHRKEFTQQQIAELNIRAKQIIILSHDHNFLRLVWDRAVKSKTKSLCISVEKNSSIIKEWDIEQFTRGEYLEHYECLSNFLENAPSESLKEVARCIRPLLEGNLRLRYPKQFKHGEWLGDFIGKIENYSGSDSIGALKSQIGDLNTLNNFSKRYHHVTSAIQDEPISEIELRELVKLTLKLIEGTILSFPAA